MLGIINRLHWFYLLQTFQMEFLFYVFQRNRQCTRRLGHLTRIPVPYSTYSELFAADAPGFFACLGK